jgi:thioredoxin 1
MSNYKKWNDLSDNTPKVNQEFINSLCPHIQTLQQKQELIQTNRVVCIDVYGDWCQPCKIIDPHFANLAKKYNRQGKCMLAKENVDLQLSQNIQGVPCFLFFKDGRYIDSITGGDMPMVEDKILHLLSNIN